MSDPKTPVRVRFAPSPTGRLHIGGGRTALYNYLLAKQTGGQFILRLEDTDQKRFQEGAEQEMIDGLRWLGLEWDEGPDVGGPYAPYRQSERKERYQAYARQLIEQGDAFYCFCSSKRLNEAREHQRKHKLPIRYDGACRTLTKEEAQARVDAGEAHVVRFKMPYTGKTIVTDAVRGKIEIDNAQLDDYILVKSDGLAVYHLASMADDHDMKITHVFRGSEWLPTFPLHKRIYDAFGWEEPVWVHLSVFLKPSGKGKMSKRESADLAKDNKSIFLTDLADLGYTPEAVVNWIALMGWSYDDRTEFFTMENLIEKFSIEKLNGSPAAINFTKFDHFNGLHIRALELDDLAERMKPYFAAGGIDADDETLQQLAPILQTRLKGMDDILPMAGFFFNETVAPFTADLLPRKTSAAEAATITQRTLPILESATAFTHDELDTPLRELADELGFKPGQVFGVLRSSVTGQRVSPPLFETMEIIGKDKVLARIRDATTQLEVLAAAA